MSIDKITKTIELKVGDYVRTENGIDKVMGYRYEPEYENGHVVWFKKSDSGCRFTDKDLPKSSPNIIDLIEEKDIITYEYETSIGTIIEYNVTVLLSLLNELEENPNKYKIKSIITHEQIETMEYKIEK